MNCCSLSTSGSSCTRYTKVFFILATYSATFLLAKSINSSISLLASLLSLKYTPVGLPFSSRSNFTSTLSKVIAPKRIRLPRNFSAKVLSVRIASTTLAGTARSLSVIEVSAGMVYPSPTLACSITDCASS